MIDIDIVVKYLKDTPVVTKSHVAIHTRERRLQVSNHMH